MGLCSPKAVSVALAKPFRCPVQFSENTFAQGEELPYDATLIQPRFIAMGDIFVGFFAPAQPFAQAAVEVKMCLDDDEHFLHLATQ